MTDRLPRSLLLIPEPLAADLIQLAEDLVAAWVVDPLLVVVLGDGSVGPEKVTPDVNCRIIGRDGTVEVDLLDELGERPTDLLRVVGMNIDESLLGEDATNFREEALRVEAMLQRSSSTHNDISSLNLIVAETQASGLDAARLMMPSWDFNVVASTENRTGLESFDAFVRRSRMRDLQGFILAHALSLAGLWAGMSSAPYDGVEPRKSSEGVDLQRISIRGIIAQDFMVQMAMQGLELLVQEETPLRDPTIRSQLAQQQEQLNPIRDDRVDEAVNLLAAFVTDGVDGRPLRYVPLPLTHLERSRQAPMRALAGFARFSLDKFRILPSWIAYRVRSAFAARTGRALHGEDGAELIEEAKDPFGDAAEFERDITDAAELRQRGLDALATPPAVTADGPDTYTHLWAAFRQGAFRLLDGGDAPNAQQLTDALRDRKLDGTLPNVASICPDARDPWSPHPEVAALLEAETRELPLTVGWLDVHNAAQWADVLERLAATYDERVAAVNAAQRLVESELTEAVETVIRCDEGIAAVDALLELDEHDAGPIIDARIDAALAGVDAEVRGLIVVERSSLETVATGDVDAGSERDDLGPEDEQIAAKQPAFDREIATAWRIELEAERAQADSRRTTLVAHSEELEAEEQLLEQVYPVVTDDLLSLRAWRWRLERSFAGKLVKSMESDRHQLEVDYAAAEQILQMEHEALDPKSSLYSKFIRRMSTGILIVTLFLQWLWRPLLDLLGVEYTEQSPLVAGYFGVPVYPFVVLVSIIAIWALLDYHRKWSRRARTLAEIRHQLRQISQVVHHLQLERQRTSELHRQAREMLRVLSEVMHRPFLLDGISDALPSSRSLDPDGLPKVVRFARPEVDDSWTGEIRFTQRILKSQLRRGWRSDAYERLLATIQDRHAVVKGALDAARADQDPVVRTAVLEHLLLDDAQRDAGIQRIREVLRDILSWSVESNFPYPKVRIIRNDRDPIDVRTDMFADSAIQPEEWQGFLGADAAADEDWSPKTFATGHVTENRGKRKRFVHAPPRLHGVAAESQTIEPRAGEVRPVEMVVRIDVLPESIAASRAGVFDRIADIGDDRGGTRRRSGKNGASSEIKADVAAEDAVVGAGVDGSDAAPSDAEEHRYNF